MQDENKPMVKVMWTGGFDSTFRICQLAKIDVDIQPYYFYNKARKSADIEIETLKKIRKMILSKDTTKANLMPVIIHDIDEFMPIDEEYMQAYETIKKREHYGDQYRWMAQMSKTFPGLELTIESCDKPEPDRFLDIMPANNVEAHGEGVLGYYTLTENNPEDFYTLLKNFRFPMQIAHMTKKDCLQAFIDMGDEDIMKETWFCQLPFNGDACGYCGPCRQVMDEGMSFRLSPAAQKRYKYRFWYLLKHKVIKGFKVLLGKEKIN